MKRGEIAALRRLERWARRNVSSISHNAHLNVPNVCRVEVGELEASLDELAMVRLKGCTKRPKYKPHDTQVKALGLEVCPCDKCGRKRHLDRAHEAEVYFDTKQPFMESRPFPLNDMGVSPNDIYFEVQPLGGMMLTKEEMRAKANPPKKLKPRTR